MTQRKNGRPPRMDEAIAKKLEKALKLGASHRMACAYAGCGTSTFYRAMQAGREAKSGHAREFWERMKKAEADAAMHWLGQIEAAAKKGCWQAAAWRLERRYPMEWGRRTIVIEPPSEEIEDPQWEIGDHDEEG